ncbi:MAG: transposase family protein, partial [Myxococcota bacterium]
MLEAGQGVRVDGEEGLLVFMWRLAYPVRWRDMEMIFRRSEAVMRRVCDVVRERLLTVALEKLEELDVDALLPWMATFEAAMARKGAPFEHCCALLDGTFRAIARPSRTGYRGPLQRAFYNSYKKRHGIEFLAVVTPDGLMREANGPHAGCLSEHTLLKMSKLLRRMQALVRRLGRFTHLYADALFSSRSYPGCGLISATPKSRCATPTDVDLNTQMSAIRVPIEWTFGKVIS